MGARRPILAGRGVLRTARFGENLDDLYGTWYGMLAPAKTPKPVLTALNEAMSEASRDPELDDEVRKQGMEPRNIGLDKFDAHIRAEMARLDPVLKTVAAAKR
jgi:tripartite-type tricarboxylate transporter receptor subunit TctC